jgi:hypothetical protein
LKTFPRFRSLIGLAIHSCILLCIFSSGSMHKCIEKKRWRYFEVMFNCITFLYFKKGASQYCVPIHTTRKNGVRACFFFLFFPPCLHVFCNCLCNTIGTF